MRKFKIAFLICLILAAAVDLLQSYAQAILQALDHTTVPLHSLGFQFEGLESIFKDVHTVGYVTDKDLNNPLAVAQFEQAQYMLAPTILDLNHSQWRWVIVDCTSPEAGMQTIKHLGLTPLKIHNGIILALNPNGV